MNFNLHVGKDLLCILGYDSRMWLSPLGIFSSNRNKRLYIKNTISRILYQEFYIKNIISKILYQKYYIKNTISKKYYKKYYIKNIIKNIISKILYQISILYKKSQYYIKDNSEYIKIIEINRN